jgi:Tfp pilus assembly protein PilE
MNRGATLIEVLIATVIVTVVALTMGLFFPKAAETVARIQARGYASHSANSTLQTFKGKPYLLVPLTTQGAYFQPSVTSPCDCNTVDFSNASFPSSNKQTITNGKVTYTEAWCVNLVESNAGAWQSHCPGSTDKGFKNVVVNLAWKVGSNSQSLTMGTLISQNVQVINPQAQTGNFIITLCQHDPAQPLASCPGKCGPFSSPQVLGPPCDASGVNNPALTSDLSTPPSPTEVAVYKPNLLADNQGSLLSTGPNGTVVNFSVPADTGYSVQVQKLGYFPFHMDFQSVAPGATTYIYAYMRDTFGFGSKLTGEAFVDRYPVISKVISGVAQPNGCTTGYPLNNGGPCDNATEAVELYNPTMSTFTVGSGGNLKVQYCNATACRAPDDFTLSPFTITNKFLYPGSYLLIVGLDNRTGANPLGLGRPSEWNVAPDVSYDVFDPNIHIP